LTKPIDERELAAAIRLAAARHEEFARLEEEVTRAHQALEDRKRVERAKGILMSELALGETEAFRRIQKLARNTNRRLVDVADFVIENETLIAPLLSADRA